MLEVGKKLCIATLVSLQWALRHALPLQAICCDAIGNSLDDLFMNLCKQAIHMMSQT
jgi:hypothetical protein